MAENTNKTTALNNAVSQIEKTFGKGSIMKLGGKEVVQIPSISSGCIALDIITGIGGYPRSSRLSVDPECPSGHPGKDHRGAPLEVF